MHPLKVVKEAKKGLTYEKMSDHIFEKTGTFIRKELLAQYATWLKIPSPTRVGIIFRAYRPEFRARGINREDLLYRPKRRSKVA
jgi:hypothetical protein